jgi:hypothetical protein
MSDTTASRSLPVPVFSVLIIDCILTELSDVKVSCLCGFCADPFNCRVMCIYGKDASASPRKTNADAVICNMYATK